MKSVNVTDFFAPWDARLVQHLLLYPLFILCAWTSLHIGWQPLWRTLPIQLSCALGFAVLASPALVMGEMMMGEWHGDDRHHPRAWTRLDAAGRSSSPVPRFPPGSRAPPAFSSPTASDSR